MINATVAALGRLDILVNNAGIFGNAAFELMTEEEWRRMIDINLNSVFTVSQVAVRHWIKAQQPGNIINLASISATVAFTESAHYCAAKGGVAELTRCIATELGPQGIRCNSMAPGIIATAMTAASLNDPTHSGDWLVRIPLSGKIESLNASVAGSAALIVANSARKAGKQEKNQEAFQ